jgi:hypothetical protein
VLQVGRRLRVRVVDYYTESLSVKGMGPTLLRLFSFGAGAAFTGGLVVHAYLRSTFVGDDLTAFWAIHTLPFFRYLAVPLGGQLVVLHRTLTFAIYSAFPMRFSVAVIVLGALEAVAAVYVYRTLDLMKPSRVNAPLVAYYLMNVFIGIQLMWWSSGLTRFGYLACAAIAVYHYLSYTRTKNVRDIAIVGVAGVLALGFYAKALLVPFYCIAVGAASKRDARLGRRERVVALSVLALLVGIGAVYAVVAHAQLNERDQQLNMNLPNDLAFVRGCWGVFLASLGDHILALHEPVPFIFVAVPALFALYSVWRVRSTAALWLMLAVLVSVNILFVGLSSRTLIFGDSMIVEYRHYFELMFPFVLLFAAVLHRLGETPEARWLSLCHPAVVPTGLAILVLVHAVASARAMSDLLAKKPDYEAPPSLYQLEIAFYEAMPKNRSFLDNLIGDVRALERRGAPPPAFKDGDFPKWLDPLDFTFRRYSQLFRVLGARARFVTDRRATYMVREDGHVVRAAPE